MTHALKRHKQGKARVIPIILRPCDWKTSPFARLQCLPHDGKAVTSWKNQDEAFLTSAEELRRLIERQQIPNQRSAIWDSIISLRIGIVLFLTIAILGVLAAMMLIRTHTPPALVQKASQRASAATVMQETFPSPVTARNLIVVAITQWEGTVTSVTDNRGDTYIQARAAQCANTSTNKDYVELYYAKKVMGGATTITVHFSTIGNNAAPNDMNVGIYEYSGLDTINPVDQVVARTGQGSQLNGGTLQSTTGSELYFVVGVDDDGQNIAPTAGSGYTLEDHQDNSNNERFYTEDRVAGPGSFQTDFSIATPSYWAVIGVSFKPA